MVKSSVFSRAYNGVIFLGWSMPKLSLVTAQANLAQSFAHQSMLIHGFPTLKKISDEFKNDKNFVPVAIQTTFEGFSVNNASQMRAIQMRYDLDMVFGHDEGKEGVHPHTMRSYRSGGTPWAVLISPDGKVIFNDFNISSEGAIKFLKKALAEIA